MTELPAGADEFLAHAFRAPSGWVVRRHAERRWRLFRDQRWVAELGVLSTGEWWVRPDTEALPWASTYPAAARAVEALTTWWARTHPLD